ncbi:MAG: squalene synthase HpnC [Proteobacteria bacterium]|nr:squalene synthase HpnC [Pseudomonadota bacterium]
MYKLAKGFSITPYRLSQLASLNNKILADAYAHCLHIAQSHYENFPVASRFLNKNLRYPISVVYAFARSADDFADEGDLNTIERYELLDDYMHELETIEENSLSNHSSNPIFIALADVIEQFQIPIKLFKDLISAFKSDVHTTRYQNFDQVMAYCQKSANPVGRILLYLNNSASEENLNYSDAICSSLQLINFYQDIAQDMDENDRLYLSLDELQKFSITIEDIKNKTNNTQTQSLMNFQIKRAQQLILSGKPLCHNLSGRFALEIRLIYTAGNIILKKLSLNTNNIYLRPRLNKIDKIKILWHGLFF